MQRRTLIATGLATVGIGLVPAAAVAADVGGRQTRRLLRHLSAARGEAGLPALDWHPALGAMARRQALHMHRSGETTHLDAGGGDPPARARQTGYSGLVLGETLAETYDGPRETMELWLAHDGTRDVLLDPAAREFGICGLREQSGLIWWDLVLGRPQDTLPPLA